MTSTPTTHTPRPVPDGSSGRPHRTAGYRFRRVFFAPNWSLIPAVIAYEKAGWPALVVVCAAIAIGIGVYVADTHAPEQRAFMRWIYSAATLSWTALVIAMWAGFAEALNNMPSSC